MRELSAPPGSTPVPPQPAAPAPSPARAAAASIEPGRRHRRRRSAALLPPLPEAADVPEDAEGRVRFITVMPEPDIDPEPAVPSGPTETGALGAVASHEPGLRGWTAVAVVAAVIVVVFIVGMRLTG